MLEEAGGVRYRGWKSNRGMEVALRYRSVGVMGVVPVVVGIHHASAEVAAQAEARIRWLYEMVEGLVEERIRCSCATVAVLGVARTTLGHADVLSDCAESRYLWMYFQCSLEDRPSVT